MWWQFWAAALENVEQNLGGIRSHLSVPAEEPLSTSLPSAPAVHALCSCSASGSLSRSAHAQEAPQPEHPEQLRLLHGSLGRGTAAPARSCALQEVAVGSSGNCLRELKSCRRWEGKVSNPWCSDVQQQVCRNLGLVQPAGQRWQIQLLWAYYKGK